MGRKKGSTTTAAVKDMLAAYGDSLLSQCVLAAMNHGTTGVDRDAVIERLKRLHDKHSLVKGTFPANAASQLSRALDTLEKAPKKPTLKHIGKTQSRRYCSRVDHFVEQQIRTGLSVILPEESWLYAAVAYYADRFLAPHRRVRYVSVISSNMAKAGEGTNPDITAYTSRSPGSVGFASNEIVAFDAKRTAAQWVTNIGPVSTYQRFANRVFLVLPVACAYASLVPLMFARDLREFASRSGLGILAIVAIPQGGEAQTPNWWSAKGVWKPDRVGFFPIVNARSNAIDPCTQSSFLAKVMTIQNINRRPEMKHVLSAAQTGTKKFGTALEQLWFEEFRRFRLV